VPAAHVPVDAQQPPLHAVSAGLPHAGEQAPVVVLHAVPLGQSVALVQPGGASGAASGGASVAASGPASFAGGGVVASRACPSTAAASSGDGASKPGLPSSEKDASGTGCEELEKHATRPAHESAIAKGRLRPQTLPMAWL
jgi:hypothetical protein